MENKILQNELKNGFTFSITQLQRRLQYAQPFSTRELWKRILQGSIGATVIDKELRETSFLVYIIKFIARTLPEYTKVNDNSLFIKFMRVAAKHTATNINYGAMGAEIGVSAPTVRKWTNILLECGIVRILQPYVNPAFGRQLTSQRMYFADTGLCAYLLDLGSARELEESPYADALFETWCVNRLHDNYASAGVEPPMYFYRDSNKKAIDVLLLHGGVLTPLQVRVGKAPKKAVRAFSVLRKHLPASMIDEGAVICTASAMEQIDSSNWYVPAWLI